MRVALGTGLAATIVAALALLPGAGSPAPEAALATHGKQCGVVAKGSRDFLVLGKRLRCERARKGARRYLRRGRRLKGFSCRRNVGDYKFVCKKKRSSGRTKSYRAQRI